MDKKLFLFTLLITIFWNGFAADDQQSPLLRAGDRVNFIGNSITHGGHYNNYITRYYLTRYPSMKVDFFNLGIAGDTADGLIRRMDSDILANGPTVAILMIGMNDAGMTLYADTCMLSSWEKAAEIIRRYENYKTNIDRVLKELRPAVRELVVFTPSIYDQTVCNETMNFKGTNDALYTFGEYLKRTVPAYDARIVDMWRETNDVNRAMQLDDPTRTVISSDRVHPLQLGGYVMAYRFLQDVGESAYVSDVRIDGRKNVILKSYNAEVSRLVRKNGVIEFDVLEKPLPYPMDSLIADANRYIHFNEELNREMLTINSLPEGEYLLTIDSIPVGRYSSEELHAGVNLALNTVTPQYKQATQVAARCAAFWQQYNDYRLLAMVDYLLLQDLSETASAEERVRAAQTRRDADPESWLAGIYDYYIMNKLRQAELYARLRDLGNSLYDLNQPATHRYQLILCSKQTAKVRK